MYDYLRILMSRLGTPYCPDCELAIGTQTADEIARAVGQHRAIGEGIVEKGGKLSEAAKVALTMINRLQGQSADAPKHAQASIARRVLQRTALTPAAHDMMADRVQLCDTLNQSAWFKGGIATCLQSYHDSFVSTLNTDFWNALGTGS